MLDTSRNVVWVSNSKNEFIYLHVKRLWPMPDWCISGTAWPMLLKGCSEIAMISICLDLSPFVFSHACHFEGSDYSFKNRLLWNYMYGQFIPFRSTCRLHELQTIHLTDVAWYGGSVSMGCGPNMPIQCKIFFEKNGMILFIFSLCS